MDGGKRRRSLPRSIGVIGGGTAGYFAALAVKAQFPGIDVTVVESRDIPIIGVGEATTTLMPPFLHGQLGLDVVDFWSAVKPTFKLGIRFEWGLPGDYAFTYPFGDADPVNAVTFDGDLRAQSLVSMLMERDRAPVLRSPEGEILSLLPSLKFAYHLDNAPFVALLAATAASRGILHVDATIDSVTPGADRGGIDSLHTASGDDLRFDFYIDASGFRSLLLGAALETPFSSYASSLFCDRAVVATVPQPGVVRPYTTAETMNAGWCWKIPVIGEDHRGYVYSSSFIDDDTAAAEMRAKNPGMGNPSLVRFRSGRYRDFWVGNTVGVGNAYGFVEPLESTALHMVIIEIAYVLAGLAAMRDKADDMETFPAFASEAVGSHWDYLRWFLAVHYRYNRRLDTPFWRAARSDVDVSGLQPVLDRFAADGPSGAEAIARGDPSDPTFGFAGLTMLLLGQHVNAPVTLQTSLTRDAWRAQVDRNASLVARALPHRDALTALTAHPEMLRAMVASRSWIRGEAERVSVTPTRRLQHPLAERR